MRLFIVCLALSFALTGQSIHQYLTNKIQSNGANEDLVLEPNGSGKVDIQNDAPTIQFSDNSNSEAAEISFNDTKLDYKIATDGNTAQIPQHRFYSRNILQFSLTETLNNSGIWQARTSDGTTASPGYSFLNEGTTGFALLSAGMMGVSVLSNSIGVYSTQGFGILNGSAASPAIYFKDDTGDDTGIFLPSNNTVGFASAGTEVALLSTIGFGILNGSAASPAVYFKNDTGDDTGLFLPSNNTMGFASAGTEVALLNTSGFGIVNGTAASPAIYFKDDSGDDTGMFLQTNNVVGFSANGTNSVSVDAGGVVVNQAGSATNPTIQLNDTDTGIFRDGSNNVVLTSNGVKTAAFGVTTEFTIVSSSLTDTACFTSGGTGLKTLGICASSIQFKENVKTITDEESSKIYDFRPVSFDWKKDGKQDYGFIAEELNEIEPKLVFKEKDGSALGVNYRHMVALLVKEVQRLSEKIEALEGAQ